MIDILINILHGALLIYILSSIVGRPILLGTPFVLAYIFSRKKRIYFKILLFFGAFLLVNIVLFWLYSDNLFLRRIQKFFIYTLVCFFIYYAIAIGIFLQKSKTTFSKILSTIVISLIFTFLVIFYIEQEEIIKVEGPFGSERRIDYVYGLKQTFNDNPNFMVAWDKKNHGVILKWRYVIFVEKKGKPEIKAVSEEKFQKLLKEQQGIKK